MLTTVLGIDIGGTHLRLGLAGEDLTLSGFELASSTFLNSPDAPCLLADFISGYLERMDCAPRAVSIGFPSTLDRARRRLLSTPNIMGLNDVPMADILQEKLNIPVFIDRDVNLLFLNDCRHFGLAGNGVIIGCYIGTGLGNVISINGEILKGKNGVAAELGHIPAWGRKEECPCGNRGCVEMFASGKRLKELNDSYFPGTKLDRLFLKYSDHELIRDYVDGLSIPIATEINLLDPDYVLLGGGVLQMEGFPRPYLEECILRHTRKPYPAEGLQLRYSEKAQENGVIGAAIRAYMELEKVCKPCVEKDLNLEH
jgi:allose kinase